MLTDFQRIADLCAFVGEAVVVGPIYAADKIQALMQHPKCLPCDGCGSK